LNYEGNVVKSCIHCHQVREAERHVYRSQRQPIPERVLYPYPLPDVIGLTMDSREMATIKDVAKGSLAERAGFQPGDAITALEKQPVLSIADVQWVLHQADDEDTLQATVTRHGKTQPITLQLQPGWRRESNLSWRPTTWDLRRMALGGMVLEELTEGERESADIAEGTLALRAKGVGQYGEHARAKNAGFQKGDVIVAIEGKSPRLNETGFIAHVLNSKQPGEKLSLSVLRGGKRMEMSFAVQ
jgi:S1-C subfamily serine protease